MSSAASKKTALLIKPTKSLYKGALGKRIVPWTWRNELKGDRMLVLLCIVLLPISIGLYGGGVGGQKLLTSTGDGQNVAFAQLGYSQICVTLVDSNGNVSPQDCAHIGTDCSFAYSAATQQAMQADYGQVDTELSGCSEFNAYRAFHVLGIIFAGIALLFMTAAHVGMVPAGLLVRFKVLALETAFASGCSGVIAHCLFVDWWWANAQFLVTLAFLFTQEGVNGIGSQGIPTISLEQSFFDLTGGWVCAIASALLYIFHFKSAASK